jgi:hypothetical protein
MGESIDFRKKSIYRNFRKKKLEKPRILPSLPKFQKKTRIANLSKNKTEISVYYREIPSLLMANKRALM